MMSSSSIFSFDTLDLRGFRPKAMIATLLALIAIEVGVGRSQWVWSCIPASDCGVIDEMERRIIAPAQNPAIVMLGNSRLRDALTPGVLEERLALPKGSVLNLGMTVGSAYDSLTMYRRNRERFSRAKILVLHLDDFDLARMRPTERFRRFATLDERLALADGEDRMSALVGLCWRTLDAQMPLQRIFVTVVFGRDPRLHIGEDGRITWRKNDLEYGPAEVDLSSYRGKFLSFEPGELPREYTRELIRLATADGLRVVVFRSPFRDVYVDLSDELPRRNDCFEAFCDTLPSEVHRVLLHRASELGIRPIDFYDYGHLTANGARIVTECVADDLLANLPDAIAACCGPK